MAGKEPAPRNGGALQRREAGTNPFLAMQQAMNRDFDTLVKRFFGDEAWPQYPKISDWPTWEAIGPRVNVSQQNGMILVEAEIPGMESKELEVSVTDNVLTLKGEHKEEKEEKDKDVHRQEFSYGSFQRSVSLPARVQADKAQSSFDKGILKLTLPVVQEERDRIKKIPIKVG